MLRDGGMHHVLPPYSDDSATSLSKLHSDNTERPHSMYKALDSPCDEETHVTLLNKGGSGTFLDKPPKNMHDERSDRGIRLSPIRRRNLSDNGSYMKIK